MRSLGKIEVRGIHQSKEIERALLFREQKLGSLQVLEATRSAGLGEVPNPTTSRVDNGKDSDLQLSESTALCLAYDRYHNASRYLL